MNNTFKATKTRKSRHRKLVMIRKTGLLPVMFFLSFFFLIQSAISQPFYYEVRSCDPAFWSNSKLMDVNDVAQIIETDDGHWLTLSTATYQFSGGCNRRVVKLSKISRTNGEEAWTKYYRHISALTCSDNLEAVGICAVPAHLNPNGKEAYIIAANQVSNAVPFNVTGVVLRIGNNGSLGSMKTMGNFGSGTADILYRPSDADPTTDDEDIVVLYDLETTSGNTGFGINILDPVSLNSNFRRAYGYGNYSVFPDNFVELANDRSLYIIGHSEDVVGSTTYSSDLVLGKIANNGTLQWIEEHETPGWLEDPADIDISTDPSTKSVAIVGTAVEDLGGGVVGSEQGLFVEFDNSGMPFSYSTFNNGSGAWPANFRGLKTHSLHQQYFVVGTAFEIDKTSGRVGTIFLSINDNGTRDQELLDEFMAVDQVKFEDVIMDEDFQRSAVLGLNQHNITIHFPFDDCATWKMSCHDEVLFNESDHFAVNSVSGNSYSYAPAIGLTILFSAIDGDVLMSHRGCINQVGNPASIFDISGSYPPGLNVNPPPVPLEFRVSNVVEVINSDDENILVLGNVDLSYDLITGVRSINEVGFLAKIDRMTHTVLWITTFEDIDYSSTTTGIDLQAQDVVAIPGAQESYAVALAGGGGAVGAVIAHIDYNGAFIEDYTLTGIESIRDLQYSSHSSLLNVLASDHFSFDHAIGLTQLNVSSSPWTMTTRKAYGGVDQDIYSVTLHESSNGDLFIAGYQRDAITQNPSNLVIGKLTSNNTLVWMNSYPADGLVLIPTDIEEGINPGTIVVIGDAEDNIGNMRTFFLSVDKQTGVADGLKTFNLFKGTNELWNRGYEIIKNICGDHYSIVGRLNSPGSYAVASNSVMMVQLDKTGAPLESRVEWVDNTDYKLGSVVEQVNRNFNVAGGNFDKSFFIVETTVSGAGNRHLFCGVNEMVSANDEIISMGIPFSSSSHTPGLSDAFYSYLDRSATRIDQTCPSTLESSPLPTSSESLDVTDLSVYPNPFTDHIRVNIVEGAETVSLFNSSGQLILESSTQILNTTSLSEGIYYLKVVKQNGDIIKQKVVKY